MFVNTTLGTWQHSQKTWIGGYKRRMKRTALSKQSACHIWRGYQRKYRGSAGHITSEQLSKTWRHFADISPEQEPPQYKRTWLNTVSTLSCAAAEENIKKKQAAPSRWGFKKNTRSGKIRRSWPHMEKGRSPPSVGPGWVHRQVTPLENL